MFVFVPEDGTGVAGANAYHSLSSIRDYLRSRGKLATWDGTALTAVVTFDASTDAAHHAAHGMITGDGPVKYSGGTLPAELVAGTEYWVVEGADADHYLLAASYGDAAAASPVTIDLTTAGSGTITETRPDFDKQRAAVVLATDHTDLKFGDSYRGFIADTVTQGLLWPRSSAYDDRGVLITGLPGHLTWAVAEFALRALSEELVPDLPDGFMSTETVSDGPQSRSVNFYRGLGGLPAYPAVDRMLRAVTLSPRAVRA